MGLFSRPEPRVIENIHSPSPLLAEFLRRANHHFGTDERIIDALMVQIPYEDLDIMTQTYASGALFLTSSRLFAFGLRAIANDEVFASIDLSTIQQVHMDAAALIVRLTDKQGWAFPQPQGDVARFAEAVQVEARSSEFATQVHAELNELPVVDEPPTQEDPPPTSIAEEIRKLAELRDEGVITVHEFEAESADSSGCRESTQGN